MLFYRLAAWTTIGFAVSAVWLAMAIAMRLATTFWTFWTLDIAFWFLFEFTVRDFDFALLVHADDDDFEGIADFDHLGGIFDIVPSKSRDMAEAIAIAEEVDEGAVILNAGDFAFEHFADFGFAGDLIDHCLGLLDDGAVMVIDGNDTTLSNIDGDIVAIADDALNGFAAFADDITDFGGVNLEGDHLWRIFGDFFAWLRDASFDGFADFSAGAFGLFKSLVENFTGDTVDLDVHLKGGKTFFGASALEVHITEVIFQTLDIGEDGIWMFAI